MEYCCSREKINCNDSDDDDVSEEYMWSNAYRLSEK